MTREDWEMYKKVVLEAIATESHWVEIAANEEERKRSVDNIVAMNKELEAIDAGDYEKVFELNKCETEKEFEEQYGYA